MSAFPTIDYTDPRPIYQQVVDGFRRAVVSGGLRPGDQFPSVRDLARELLLNPNTIQHAYRELEREGLLEVRRGLGSFVTESAVAERQAAVQREVAQAAIRLAAAAGMSAVELVDAVRRVIGDSSRQSRSA